MSSKGEALDNKKTNLVVNKNNSLRGLFGMGRGWKIDAQKMRD